MVIVTDEEWDIRNLRSSESLNKSISDEADLEEDVRRVSTAVQGSGRLDRQSRVLGTYDVINVTSSFESQLIKF